jgi:hypothetical protein
MAAEQRDVKLPPQDKLFTSQTLQTETFLSFEDLSDYLR